MKFGTGWRGNLLQDHPLALLCRIETRKLTRVLEPLLTIANGDVSPNATLAQRLRQKDVRAVLRSPFAHCLPPAAAYRATGRDGRRGLPGRFPPALAQRRSIGRVHLFSGCSLLAGIALWTRSA